MPHNLASWLQGLKIYGGAFSDGNFDGLHQHPPDGGPLVPTASPAAAHGTACCMALRVRRIIPVLAGMLLLAWAGVGNAATRITLAPVGGIYDMFTRPMPAGGGRIARPVRLRLTVVSPSALHGATVVVGARDIFGHRVAWHQTLHLGHVPVSRAVTVDVNFNGGMGYFLISAHLAGAAAVGRTNIGVIPPWHPGLRPNSFFASNLNVPMGKTLDFLQAIGMKVARVEPNPVLKVKNASWIHTLPRGRAVPQSFKTLDREWAADTSHGIWWLPSIGYSLQGANTANLTPLARALHMYGPPNDYGQFVQTWRVWMKHFPQIHTYEFWNEPWIFGWTWAAPGARYRVLQREICRMALQVNRHVRMLAGNSSAFIVDHIEFAPSCWKGLLSGLTHHPYTYSGGRANWRAGDNLRSMDDAKQAAIRMGLTYTYLTEGGTQYPVGAIKPGGMHYFGHWMNNRHNAFKIVQYFVQAAEDGMFMGNMQLNIGYGPNWTCSNTTFAVMTHFLEDRPIVADIWPREELIRGAIFADPRWITPQVRRLPRARQISARWGVAVPASRGTDPTKVAVVWSCTGQSDQAVDRMGTLTIIHPQGLKAYDMTGRIIQPTRGRLVLPFNDNPVYITTKTLSVMRLYHIIRGARISNVTAVNCYALSLMQPANKRQTVLVRLENQLPDAVHGTLRMTIAAAGKTVSTPFVAGPGRLVEVPIAWPGVAIARDNDYGVSLKAVVAPDQTGDTFVAFVKKQLLSTARFVRRTVHFTGKLSDWRGLTPVLMDSRMFGQHVDLTRYLRNPDLKLPTAARGKGRIIARIYTAYSREFVYIGAAVLQQHFSCAVGTPALAGRSGGNILVPYKRGLPDGLDYPINCGDVLEFAFGFRPRVPGWGRQINDLWAWKGSFYDTDYAYFANTSTTGDMLTRVWGPHSARRNGYQAAPTPGIGPVPGGIIKITRNRARHQTLYEIAIPRSQMTLFKPALKRFRFGLILYNSEHAAGGSMNYSTLAGVFRHWRSNGSFPPTWTQRLPCEAFWGVSR